MPMEKCNVVEDKRTPKEEIDRKDENWDKDAAAAFQPPKEPAVPKVLTSDISPAK